MNRRATVFSSLRDEPGRNVKLTPMSVRRNDDCGSASLLEVFAGGVRGTGFLQKPGSPDSLSLSFSPPCAGHTSTFASFSNTVTSAELSSSPPALAITAFINSVTMAETGNETPNSRAVFSTIAMSLRCSFILKPG